MKLSTRLWSFVLAVLVLSSHLQASTPAPPSGGDGEFPENYRIEKSDDGEAAVGQPHSYLVTLHNEAQFTGTIVVSFTEIIPDFTTFLPGASDSWDCQPDNTPGSVCTIPVGTLGPGESDSRVFTVLVDANLPAGVDALENTAEALLLPSTTGNDPSDDLVTLITPVLASPDLAVSKAAPAGPYGIGDQIDYSISYSNVGDQGATGVVLTENLPPFSHFLPGSSSPWNCTLNTGPSICTLDAGSLPAGDSREALFAVLVGAYPAEENQLVNTVSIEDDSANGSDPNPTNNTDSLSLSLDTVRPDLAIGKDDGGVNVVPGQVLVYTLTYQNIGNRDESGVFLSEAVPQGSTFDAAQSDTRWVCESPLPLGTGCSLSLETLLRGETGEVFFAVRADSTYPAGEDLLSNTAVIGGDGTWGSDANPADNQAVVVTPIDAAPDLSVTKMAPEGPFGPNDVILYNLRIQNLGTQEATGTIVGDDLPPFTDFISSGSTPGWSCGPNPAPTCVLDIGNLEAGGILDLTIAAQVGLYPIGTTTLLNSVQVSDDLANGPDPDLGNNTDTATSFLQEIEVDLVLAKSDGGATAEPGEGLLYTLTYQNVGNVLLGGVELSETVPHGAVFSPVLSDPRWNCPSVDPGTLCSLDAGSLEAGGVGEVLFGLLVDATFPAGFVEISNTASVADDGTQGPDRTPSNNIASDETPIPGLAVDLAVTNDDSGVSVIPGGVLTYQHEFQNLGILGASGVQLSTAVPENAEFLAELSDPRFTCAGTGPGTVCTLTLPLLAAGQADSGLFTVRISADLPGDVLEISNTATVADDGTNGPDVNPANNSESETTPVVREAGSLAVTKWDSFAFDADEDGVADVGDQILYTMEITAAGRAVLEVQTRPQASSHLVFIAGSAATTIGVIKDGTTSFALTIPELEVGQVATVTFLLEVVDNEPGDYASCHAQVMAANAPEVSSDDPDTPEPFDPTLTLLGDGIPTIHNIPTVGSWGLVLLVALLAFLGARAARRKRTLS